jgi:hypothetical protein
MISLLVFSDATLAARQDSDFNMISFSSSPFLNKVLPLLTRSQIASARPMFGAISTEPDII